jgi:signal transduction histidine kinase
VLLGLEITLKSAPWYKNCSHILPYGLQAHNFEAVAVMEKKLAKLRDEVLGDVSSRQYLKTPYLIFAVSILLTVAITYFFYISAVYKDRARFSTDVIKIQSTIKNRLESYFTLLKSGRGFIEAGRSGGKEIDKNSFAVFIKELELEKDFQGAQGIGFIKRVQPAEQSALTEQMRAEGHQEFHFFPPEATDKEGYVILYLEPLGKDNNTKGIGFIISSDEPKRAAIEKAVTTGQPVVSEKLTLIQFPRTAESPSWPGFQLYIPIYRSGQVPDTAEKRKEQIESLLYCPFRANNFIAEVQKAGQISDISFAIYDREIGPDNLLAESQSENKNAENSAPTQSLSQRIYNSVRFEEIVPDDMGGEKWIVKYQTLSSFHSNSSIGWTLIIFFFGLGISLILFFITLSQSKAHVSVERIAEDLARSEKVKDEFIAVVSHELRTPLNSIAGGVTILKNKNVTDDTRLKALDIIDKSLRSQVHLVEDMIVFSDISAGKDYLQARPLDFSQLVDRYFNAFLPQAQARNIYFTKKDLSGGQLVAGDEAKLEKVLQSILSNSLKFTPPGGAIAMEASANGNSVTLKVKDNGYGIHPQVLPYVFDLFKQGDSSTIRRHGGLGLGMALSRHIIKLHNGTLKAESEGVDKGSTFVLTLPVITNNGIKTLH